MPVTLRQRRRAARRAGLKVLPRAFPARSKKTVSRSSSKMAVGKLTILRCPRNILPDRYVCTMRFATEIPVTTVFDQQYIKLNSIYQPWAALPNNKPNGYETLYSLYREARVTHCSIKITTENIMNKATQLFVCPAVSDAQFTSTASNNLLETKGMRSTVIRAGISNNIGTVKHSCSPNVLFGCTKADYQTEDEYEALNNAPPPSLAQWRIWYRYFDQTTPLTTGSVLLVYCNYRVQFEKPFLNNI